MRRWQLKFEDKHLQERKIWQKGLKLWKSEKCCDFYRHGLGVDIWVSFQLLFQPVSGYFFTTQKLIRDKNANYRRRKPRNSLLLSPHFM